MDKIQDQTVEDGELTSDSEYENLAINSQNYDTSVGSHITNDYSVVNKFNNSDFQNLLTDFENHVKTKKKNYLDEKKISPNKKFYEYANHPSYIEEDELIFVRGVSPPILSLNFDNSVPSKDIGVDEIKIVRKKHKNKKENSNEYSKRRNSKSKSESAEEDHNEIDEQTSQQLKICKFYLQDNCAKTEKTCTFLHSQFPCKYYYLGLNCPYENCCKLSHEGLLSNEMKEALLTHIQIAPREILGDFKKMPPERAKKLLNERLAELAFKNIEETGAENNTSSLCVPGQKNDSKNIVINTIKNNVSFPDFLKIEQFNDILNERQIQSLKKIGVRYSYQLVALTVLELNSCDINVIEIVKIQEKVKKHHNIKSIDISNIESKIENDALKTKIDLDMRDFCETANNFSITTEKTHAKPLSPVIINETLLNSELEDIDEECNLIIDEEAFHAEEQEIELSKHDNMENIINQEQDDISITSNLFKKNVENIEVLNIYNENLQNFDKDEDKILNLSKKDLIISEDIQKNHEMTSNGTSFIKNKLNNNSDVQPIEINDYAKDLIKISNNNTLDDMINIITADVDMRLPVNSAVQNYKPATEYDGSLATHLPISWQLIEILLPTKEPIPLERIGKLQQSKDPRIRKQTIRQNMYSFDGSVRSLSNDSFIYTNCDGVSMPDYNNNEIYKKDFADPRKKYVTDSTYEIFNNQPTVMQILQHYLHQSSWYNEQNSKTKMEINELIADLANSLKKFKGDCTPNKKFYISELKHNSKIQIILKNLKVFIDTDGSILPEKKAEMHYLVGNNIATSHNYIGGFETFLGTLQPTQRQLPIISNLIPVGSFQAPVPLHFPKPGLLGVNPNNMTPIGFNNLYHTTTAIVHNNNMHFGNNIFFGNQNFGINFGNCRPPFQQQAPLQNHNFAFTQANNQKYDRNNNNKNGNNFRRRNNAKLADNYSNITRNKRLNNNDSAQNNFRNSTNKYGEDEAMNYHFKETHAGENGDFEANTTFHKEKPNNHNNSGDENWDDEDSDELPKKTKKRNEDAQSEITLSKVTDDDEENWDTDDENCNSFKTSSNLKEIPVKSDDGDLLDPPEENKEIIEKDDNNAEMLYNSESLSGNKLKSGNDCYLETENVTDLKKQNLTEPLLICNGIHIFEDTKGKENYDISESFKTNVNKVFCLENNIEISKNVATNDSEEDWD